MLKTTIACCTFIFSLSLFAFETGLYHGENSEASCDANIIQNEDSVKVVSYSCVDRMGTVVGSAGEQTYQYGKTTFGYEDEDGKTFTVTTFGASDLLEFIIEEDGVTTPYWKEAFREIEKGKIHYIFTTNIDNMPREWFDIVLTKRQ